MYETLVAALRKVDEYDSGYAKLMYDAADAIEAQDRHILTLQHEMMAEAESHTALVKRLNEQIEELQADVRPVVRGKWEEKEKDGVWWYACSVCGEHIPKGQWGQEWHSRFCPNCGADMEES